MKLHSLLFVAALCLLPAASLAQSIVPQPFQLLSNASASGPIVTPMGGSYQLSLSGTFGGTSVAITETSPSGQAFTLATYTSAITTPVCVTVPASFTVQAIITGGTPSALYSTMGGQGIGSCPSSGGSVTANQGTPGAVTAGWPTTNGEPADTTGTFTNGTQTGNVTTASVDGYAAAIISIHGTYNTATATFLASDDAGTTFYPLACNRIDGSNAPELGYTSLTNVSRAWLCATQGFDEIQVLSSAVTSGTVNVRISQSAAPIQAPSQQSVTNSGVFATQDTLTPSATVGISTQSCTVACASTIVSGAHSVYGISGSATVTGTILVYDATSCSANGTVTPKKAFAYTVANASIGISWADVPMINATGIAVCFSSTGPYTATASTTAFLSVDYK